MTRQSVKFDHGQDMKFCVKSSAHGLRNGRTERARAGLAALLRHESGVSATEFALFAPIMVFGLLMMVDVGLAAYQRMTVDHVLRAGAQSAMVDPGTSNVLKVLEIAAAENPSIGTFTVDRYCVCSNNPGVKVACSTVCAGSTPTLAYYKLSASSTYAGMIIPEMTFKPEVQVQVR